MRQIAGAQFLLCSALNRQSANLARTNGFRVGDRSAREQSSAALDHKEEVGEPSMLFGAAIAAAYQQMNRVPRILLQDLAGRTFAGSSELLQIGRTLQKNRRRQMIEDLLVFVSLAPRRGYWLLARQEFLQDRLRKIIHGCLSPLRLLPVTRRPTAARTETP